MDRPSLDLNSPMQKELTAEFEKDPQAVVNCMLNTTLCLMPGLKMLARLRPPTEVIARVAYEAERRVGIHPRWQDIANFYWALVGLIEATGKLPSAEEQDELLKHGTKLFTSP